MPVGCDKMSLYQSLTILSVTKRHFYNRTMSCVAFGCNNTAFAAQLKMSAAAHARLTADICISLPSLWIRDVTYLVRDTGIIEFVLRAFNKYFLHNGVINCIHSKI